VAILLGGLIGFGIGYYLLLKAAATFSAHHIILLWPLLLLTCACGLKIIYQRSKWIAVLLTGLLTLTQLRGVPALLNQVPLGYHDASRLAILEGLRDPLLSDAYVYVVLDWGMYYLQSLYGSRSQLVVYIDPLESQQQFDKLEAIAQRHNRRLLFIFMFNPQPSARKDLHLIESNVGSLERLSLPGLAPSSLWQVWVERAK
jgi:hypothetical protein